MAAHAHPDLFDRWYLRVLAFYYALICGVCSIRYVYLGLTDPTWHVPWLTQLLCFGMTVAAIVYFVRPCLGHHGRAAIGAIVFMFAASDGDGPAAVFHLVVLALLCLPLIGPWANRARSLWQMGMFVWCDRTNVGCSVSWDRAEWDVQRGASDNAQPGRKPWLG